VSGTSHPEGKDWTLERYLALGQRIPDLHVIDVGAGSGTYARLYRPHLRAHWTALEAWAPYIDRYDLPNLYNVVENREAQTPDPWPFAHLVLMGDVVEHLDHEDGEALIRRAMSHVGTVGGAVSVSIPIGRYDQGPIDGNPYEEHRATWWHEEVTAIFGSGGTAEWELGEVVGVYWWTP
jgi:hypothetical protein